MATIMADYPAHLEHAHTLRDGTRVLVRPVRAQDSASTGAFLAHLSEESLYRRFQYAVHLPSDRLARFLTHVDYDRHLALVCVARTGEAEEIVGEARYVVNDDDASCEMAIAIADGWHKRGVAGLLIAALIRAARARGLAVMESQVLTENREMLRFARGLGFEVRLVPEDGSIVRIVKSLQIPPAAVP